MKSILDEVPKSENTTNKTIAKINIIGSAIFSLFFALFSNFSDSMFVIAFPLYAILILPFLILSLTTFFGKGKKRTDKTLFLPLLIGLVINAFPMLFFSIWIVDSFLH
jgi:uncharacterized YccA/Bax inhibitor family protein